MTTKAVQQLDENGIWKGPTVAYESPRRPGSYLMPAGCIDAPAPDVPEGHFARWTGSEFIFEPIPSPPEPEDEAAE